MEWVEMQVRQEAFPTYEQAGVNADVAVEVLNRPGERVRSIGGNIVTVSEECFWVGIDERGISEFWKAFGQLQ